MLTLTASLQKIIVSSFLLLSFIHHFTTTILVSSWVNPIPIQSYPSTKPTNTQLHAIKFGKNYVPRWKKKETLAEKEGAYQKPSDVGLKGSVQVVFKMGDQETSTVAMPGQPIKDVASQAGQFIRYGCLKGECGTCQSLVNGSYIKPCVATVPGNIPEGERYVIQVKKVKAKRVSSGKFYSIKSIILGFWNNVLGMVGFVKTRGAAKKNWQDRQDMEKLIAEKAAEKKRLREQEAQNAGK